MRIAVSGTHGVGKSTLIDEFLRVHPEFVHEPEPYAVLVEDLGEEFSAEPCVEDFRRQLEFNIERLGQHAPGEKVIYERCPLDFLAYIHALDAKSAEALLQPVSDAIQHLDLLVYLPLEDVHDDVEYPKLQALVDQRLNAVYMADEFGILSATDLLVVEATGSTAQRLRVLESAITRQTRNLEMPHRE